MGEIITILECNGTGRKNLIEGNSSLPDPHGANGSFCDEEEDS